MRLLVSGWRPGVLGAEQLECDNRYRDCALRGIAGVIEIAPVGVELRADKAALDEDPERARQALTLFRTVRLRNTLSGNPAETVEVAARSEQHTLAEWRSKTSWIRCRTPL